MSSLSESAPDATADGETPSLDVFFSGTAANVIVHVVANGVRGDSRVLKSAIASRDAGIPAVILGVGLGHEPDGFLLDGIPVLLAPIGVPPAVPVDPPVAVAPATVPRVTVAEDQARRGLRSWMIGVTEGHPRARAAALKVARAVHLVGPIQIRPVVRPAVPWTELSALGPDGTKSATWVQPMPGMLRTVEALSAALRRLAPIAIHSHDTVPLPAAINHARERLAADGVCVPVIYDAHEWVGGLVKKPDAHQSFRVLEGIEDTFASEADAVITVSEQMADLIQARLNLSARPFVVLNAPSGVRSSDAPDLRDVIGIDSATPLLVYSGWVDPERGLEFVMKALVELPEVHLAIVAGRRSAGLVAALAAATALGVRGRVHLAGYVPPSQVTQYLSSADLGLIPHTSGEHLDVSLPTKFREYVHAGLPCVVSDNKGMQAEVLATGVGEVFSAADAADLARAVRRVLSDSQRYRGAITSAYLRLQSWEAQVPVLLAAHARAGVRVPEAGCSAAALHADIADVAGVIARWRGGDDADIARSRLVSAAGAGALEGAVRNPGLNFVEVAIGPANYAGQATAWAWAASRFLGCRAASFGTGGKFSYTVDREYQVEPRRIASDAQWLLSAHSHLIVDAFRPVIMTVAGADIGDELALLARRSIRVALAAHGSEIRRAVQHMDRLPESYFHDAPGDWLAANDRVVERNHEILSGFDGQVFVSTPDLLLDAPQARWLPLVVDPTLWQALAPALTSGRPPVVLHAASRAVPPIKGTAVIAPVLESLHASGRIRYVSAENIPHAQMPALVAGADIVVDQILTGSYGVAAIEAMCAGRLVVGSVAKDVRALLHGELPIIDAPGGKFAEVMDEVLSQLDHFAAVAAEGPGYAARWHDGRASAEALEGFLSLQPLA